MDKTFADLRRRVRAPYRVKAKLEIVGVTSSGKGWTVYTLDANEWGVRIQSPKPMPRVSVLLMLNAPDGGALTVRGWIIHNVQVGMDGWEGGIELDGPEPRLSAARIDLANFGS